MKPEDREPDIEGFEFFLDAFQELSTTRQIGLAVGPIPFTGLVDYFRIYELPDGFEDFAYVIRRMDQVYLELNAEVADKKSTTKTGEKSKSGHTNSNAANSHQGRHKRQQGAERHR